jgi:hypothetical protein
MICCLCSQVKVDAAEANLPIRVKIISYKDVVRICGCEAPSWCPAHLLKNNNVQASACSSRRDPLPEKLNDVNYTIKVQEEFLVENRER